MTLERPEALKLMGIRHFSGLNTNCNLLFFPPHYSFFLLLGASLLLSWQHFKTKNLGERFRNPLTLHIMASIKGSI